MENRNFKAVIPVAGLGTRMLPATKAIPKEMLPLADKPLIQYIVNECIAAGITEIVLVTHSSKNSIENHFDKSFELEVLDALDSSFIEYPPSLFPKTIKVLDSLKNNYSICLTSNTGITSPNYYRRYLNNVGILDKFQKLYLSNELLVAKPSLSIFTPRILEARLIILEIFSIE